MVGNVQPDNSGDILVEFDYDNIIIVDPNKTIDYQGNIKERQVDHQNLVMFANLEAEVLPRTKLAVGGSPQDARRTVSIAKINFLGPNKNDYFSTSYYDELTGLGSTDVNTNGKYGMGTNQPTETSVVSPKDKKPYNQQGVITNGFDGSVDNGLLGITSINVKLTTSFIPSVSIELIDVQGKALFSLGDQSPYAAFFNLPYPPFYLTLKGYYGQAIRYQLNLEKFSARFNTFSGSYQISLELRGFKFNVLNEIQIQHLIAAPHMYSTTYNLTNTTESVNNIERQVKSTGTNEPQANTLTGNQLVSSIVTERGYEKIVEVYSEYKAKGLLSNDFPEITFAQLLDIVETFETRIVDKFNKADVQPLTDCRTYREDLKKYFGSVYSDTDSWFNRWIEPTPLVLINGEKIYTFKINTFNLTERNDAVKKLEKIINDYNSELSKVGNLSRGRNKIENPIKLSTIKKDSYDINQINWLKSSEEKGVLPASEESPLVIDYKNKILKSLEPALDTNSGQLQPVPLFDFQSFTKAIRNLETEVNRKQSNFESRITALLAKKLEDPREGLGFKPSVRNIIGVIMATTEGFLRLMDDVHTDAWNLRNNEIRRSAVLNNNSSAPSSDSKQNVQFTNTASSDLENSKEAIYPWPQFFVETNKDVEGRFQLQYIADPSVVDITKGDEYAVWPEVEFVEEYIKGLTQKFTPPVAQPPLETSNQTNLININAVEYPQLNVAYRNKDELKFFYEIWERLYVTSYFTGLGRTPNTSKTSLITLLQNIESQNIQESLGGSSPYLTYKLKNYELNSQNYLVRLFEFSNQGTGRSWQDFIRDFIITPYLRTLTNNSYSILQKNDLGPQPQNSVDNLIEQLKSVIYTQTEPNVMDIYPFTNNLWCEKNLVNNNKNTGNKRYNTNEVLEVFEQRSVISNFNNLDDNKSKRPVTNFSYVNFKNPTSQINTPLQLRLYYLTTNPTVFLPTVGFTITDAPARSETGQRLLPLTTTTSMLNTPYFVNSISKGVELWKNNNQYPYVAASYLFLNSLPLISLREKLKSKTTTTEVNGVKSEKESGLDDLNYFFASLKKYGAIHKIPYAWILKMGSVWHRYKVNKQSGIDILNDVWTNFDFVKNYDPIGSNVAKIYSYIQNGQETKIQLQSGYNQINDIQVGFYPKTLNDFNVFYNGFDLFKDYTNDEIQGAVNKGVKIHNFTSSNIENASNGPNSFNVKTWSVLLPTNIEYSASTELCSTDEIMVQDMYVVPSFGSKINESSTALLNNNILTSGYAFAGNPSVFNGSARLFWAASNYGYFDTQNAKKPNPDEYLNEFRMNVEEMSPFRFSQSGEYMKIEDIFSVFERNILDSFEQEFLKFSKSSIDAVSGEEIVQFDSNGVDVNSGFKNFQTFFRNLMRVPLNSQNETSEVYFTNTINKQLIQIQNQISSFLEYDIIFRYGNPTNFNKRIFESYLNPNGIGNTFVDPLQFEPYVQGSLPSSGGDITLQTSKSNYPNEWLELELEIGFSTIPQLVYKNDGSYITDFFIDNNIKFSVDNIKILSPLIKIYATQKLEYGRNPNGVKFYLQEYLNQCQSIQNDFIDGVMTQVRSKLPQQSQVQETYRESVVNGVQPKVEIYEMFKALNDKWIAGSDFESKTLFEDIMFLDRASRNIGDVLLVDIFDLKKMFAQTSINPKMTVYMFIADILRRNNFTIMNLPAYVNFYNVQDVDGVATRKPEGSNDFANSFWGTFMNVDYRNSSPKMVNFFVGKPSNYLAMPDNKYVRYRSDAFDIRRASEVPLIENQQNKTDWGLSNRCVGFNVDIGIRNQNVFYSFSVGQENGKATSEAVQILYDTININSGTQTSTQNVGLYELYKNRTYPCTVECLGNAMIQPAMYFNLRNVPMFYGPYMILDVNHTIAPGTFQTSFTGVRQSIFDLPQIDKYLQSINQNLLTKIESIITNKKDQTTVIPTTNQQKQNDATKSAETKKSTEGSCNSKVLPLYLEDRFENVPTLATTLNKTELISQINKVLEDRGGGTINVTLQRAMYSFCYFASQETINSDEQFKGWNNNFCPYRISLETNYKSTYKEYFNKTYSCISVLNTTTPTANFESANRFFEFLYSRLQANTDRINKAGLTKYWTCFFNPDSLPESSYNPNNFDSIETSSIFVRALVDLNKLSSVKGLKVGAMTQNQIELIVSGTVQPNQTTTGGNPPNNLNTQIDEPTCLPPTIISFEPIIAAKNADTAPTITLSGTNLIGNTIVTLGGKPTTITLNTQTIIKFVPQEREGGFIKVITAGDETVSEQQFSFI